MSNICFTKPDQRRIIYLITLMLSLFTLILVNSDETKAADKIRIGIFSLEPHVMIDKDSGAAIDFFEKYILPELDVSVEWQHAPLARIILSLKDGDYDAGLLFSKKPEREEVAYYPRYPFYETQSCLIVMNSHPLQSVKSSDDILKYKIGYVPDGIRMPFMQDERIIFDLMHGENIRRRSLIKLKLGRIDAFYQPVCSSCLYVAKQIDMRKEIRPVYLPDRNMVYTIFSKKSPLGKILVEKYDKAIEKIIGEDTSGSRKIYEKYDEILKNYTK